MDAKLCYFIGMYIYLVTCNIVAWHVHRMNLKVIWQSIHTRMQASKLCFDCSSGRLEGIVMIEWKILGGLVDLECISY